ncbi:multicomponent Na+:H+ antiporter subunit B [Halorubrum alkaliphilum]|uniref:Multicomponent Na+:H+ antiporter subunit B n=1 Tax=Halorubrum alkaliphilum TaxID=261290 RepID=A0A8T4GFE3_9EURY|nr:MnhB domain-containing protein [Halorubrum alkaliphilum]MBP1922447.1 multicomponent Na+:H+ antiporter subunit B [Halorubrum alkaliphilum]
MSDRSGSSDSLDDGTSEGIDGFGDRAPSDTDGPSRTGRLDSEVRQGSPYTESQVIMPTVKVVAPFAFTYGLFVTFHGGGSPGGGFQGGAIMAAVVFMIAFAFGIEATREWLANTVVVGLAVGGTLVFAGIGIVTMTQGGAFLQYELLPVPLSRINRVTYGMEAVEILGIASIVSGVLMGLFFLLARGFSSEGGASGTGDSTARTDGGDDR